jgi:hypothetical protein
MKSNSCDLEEMMTSALARATLSEELGQHAASCVHCADLLLVSQFLGEAAPSTDQTAPLPMAGLIWWKAQLAERREHAERAVAAIDIMQKLALAVTLGTLSGCALIWRPIDLIVLLLGACLLVGTLAVLYGWVRGRI